MKNRKGYSHRQCHRYHYHCQDVHLPVPWHAHTPSILFDRSQQKQQQQQQQQRQLQLEPLPHIPNKPNLRPQLSKTRMQQLTELNYFGSSIVAMEWLISSTTGGILTSTWHCVVPANCVEYPGSGIWAGS